MMMPMQLLLDAANSPPTAASAAGNSDEASANQRIVFLSDAEFTEEERQLQPNQPNPLVAAADVAAAAATAAATAAAGSATASSLSAASAEAAGISSSGGSGSAVQTFKLMPIKICLSESDDEDAGSGIGFDDGDEGSVDEFGQLFRVGGAGIGMPPRPRSSGGGGNGRTRRQWSQENMLKAYNSVVSLGLSLRLAANKFKVPESTLRDRLHGRVNINCTRPGPQTFFTAGEEQRIVDHVLFLHRIGYTVLRKHITETANHLLRITTKATKMSGGGLGSGGVGGLGSGSDSASDISDDCKAPVLMNSSSHDFISLASAVETQTWLSEQSTAKRTPASIQLPTSKRCSLPSASWLYSFTHRWPKIKECVSMSSHTRRYTLEEEVTDSNRVTYLR